MNDYLSLLENKFGRNIAAMGNAFEEIVGFCCRHFPKRGDHVIDVGAHRGVHTKTLRKAVGWRGRVSAFEPIPKLYKALKADLEGPFSPVKVYPYALARIEGSAQFCTFDHNPAFSGLKRRDTPFTDEEGGRHDITVPVETLDRIIKDKRPISLVKLDIEGGELDALMGARSLLTAHQPVIVFENGQQASAQIYGYSKGDFFTFFESLSYRIFAVTGQPLTPDTWMSGHFCWEYIAFPTDRMSEMNVVRQFVEYRFQNNRAGDFRWA